MVEHLDAHDLAGTDQLPGDLDVLGTDLSGLGGRRDFTSPF
jgi:hypothetical protein